MKNNKKAFTLVELIVVITILAILGTIAFISMQNYAKSSRDSVRISDIKNLQNVLELFVLDASYYPKPTGGLPVTYTGSEVWLQGTVGDSVIDNLDRMDEKPLDPLTLSEYTYSRLNTKREFELGTVLESNDYSYSQILGGVNAAEINLVSYVNGTYNGILAKVNKENTTYILGIPTIIATEAGNLLDIIRDKKLAYNGTTNIPSSYKGVLGYSGTGGFEYSSSNSGAIVVYEGDIESLNNISNLELLANNLKEAYIGSDVENEGAYKNIIALNVSDTEQLKIIAGTIVNNNLNGSIDLTNSSSNSSSLYVLKTVSGVLGNRVLTMKGDSGGNIYVLGSFTGSTDIFGTIYSSNGYKQIYVSKLNSNLDTIWTRVTTSIGNTDSAQDTSLDVDTSGNVYVTGNFSGTGNIFGQELISSGSTDIFVSKLNSNGNLIWSKKSGGVNADAGNGIKANSSGDVYVTGKFKGETDIFGTTLLVNATASNNIFISKLDSNGNSLISTGTTSNANTSSDGGGTIDIDNNGDVYLGGTFSQTVTFFSTGAIYAGPSGRYDLFFVKFDSNLNLDWITTSGGSSHDAWPRMIEQNGYLYITGRSQSATSFGTNWPGSGLHDNFILKMNTLNGNVLWQNKYGSEGWDFGFGIDVDSNGNSYITGKFTGTANTEGQNIVSNAGSADIYIAKTDTNGNFLWQKRAGGSSGDEGNGIVVNLNNIYVGGFFKLTANIFGEEVTSSGAYDGFVVKIANE